MNRTDLEDKELTQQSHQLEKEYISREVELSEEEQEFINTRLGSKLWRMNNLYTIRNKDGEKQLLKLNPSQMKVLTQYHHTRKIILKSRQQGISTLFLAYYLDDCLFKPGYQSGIQSYGQDEAEKLADRAQLMWEDMDENVKHIMGLKLVANNSKRMMFSNGSILKIGNFRGDTLQGLHVSELGKIAKKYPEKAKELKTGAFQAVGKNNKISIESTAEGRFGLFYDMWVKAYNKSKSGKELNPLEFEAIFLSWLEDPDCTLPAVDTLPENIVHYFDRIKAEYDIEATPEQMSWYASKYDELGEEIKQEYPTTPEEAFEQSLEGTIYKQEYDLLFRTNRVLPSLFRPECPVTVAYDLGVNDATVLTFAQIVEGRPRIINVYSGTGEGLEHYVDVMWALVREQGYDIRDVILPHDAAVRDFSTGKTRYERFLELGVPARILKRQSVDEGIEATRLLLKYCVVDSSCETFLLALQQYRWKFDKKLGVTLRVPEHDWTSNYMDSFKYLALGLDYSPETIDRTAYEYPDDYTYEDDSYEGI